MNLLLVEDEESVGSTLKLRLSEIYTITWEKNFKGAIKAVTEQTFDGFILDIALPGGSGFDIALKIRSISPEKPIVFLSAFGDPDSRIKGLELGAEDYIQKPFHFEELKLRLQNALKRARFLSSNISEEWITVGRARVNFSAFKLEVDFEEIFLTHRESALLKILLSKKNRVVSRDEILDLLWSENESPSPRTIDNLISKLRKWIDPPTLPESMIRSIRGVGYELIEKDKK